MAAPLEEPQPELLAAASSLDALHQLSPPPSIRAAAATVIYLARRGCSLTALREFTAGAFAGGERALVNESNRLLAESGEHAWVLHLAARSDGGVSHPGTDTAGAGLLRELLASGCWGAVDSKDRAGFTPVHHASMAGQRETVAMLLDMGADPHTETAGLDSALHLSSLGGHVRTAAFLLDRCPELINLINRDGWTPLHLAILTGQLKGNRETAELLIHRGCALDVLSYDGWSPVLLAAHRGMDRILARLLSQGARHDLTRGQGESALHLAAAASEHECVKLLLEHGASATAMDGSGDTPFHSAVHGGDELSLVELLRVCPQGIGLVNYAGDTPMHIAASKKGKEQLLLTLLGADGAEATALAAAREQEATLLEMAGDSAGDKAARETREAAGNARRGARNFMLWRRALAEGQLIAARINAAGLSDIELARDCVRTIWPDRKCPHPPGLTTVSDEGGHFIVCTVCGCELGSPPERTEDEGDDGQVMLASTM